MEVSFSDNSNEATMNTFNEAAKNDVACSSADAAPDNATAHPPTQRPHPPILKEDPATVPPDELSFLHPPHFSPTNPFHVDLRQLDHSMRCLICGELFHAPVSVLPCLHTFCSECVRGSCKAQMAGMKRRVECPTCKRRVGTRINSNDYENALIPNHHLENQLDIYKRMRDELRSSLVRLDVLEKEKAAGVWGVAAEGKKKKKSGNCGRKRRRPKKNESDSSDDEDFFDEEETRSSKRVSGRAAAKKQNYSSSSDSDDDDDYEPERKPAAATSRTSQSHNNHVVVKLQRKPIPNYHGLKRKRLQELCTNEGLDNNGTDDDLKRRHSEFITLYNSECDSSHPRSPSELAKEITRRDKVRRKEAVQAMQNGSQRHEGLMIKLKQSREAIGKGSTVELSSGNKAFDALLSAGFQNLINQHKQRQANGGKANANAPVAATSTTTTTAAKPSEDNESDSTEDAPQQSAPTPTSAKRKAKPKSPPKDAAKKQVHGFRSVELPQVHVLERSKCYCKV
mmetsp:Transcript_8027/g.17885  ORF Transcript_8027/g.17885 Transcript_8027/m.17885 type:complete len:510 (+) Transcript_8027:1509-3038(+)